MKFNIIIMSFYSDLKLIEDTLINYQAQGFKINESLFEKIDKFKILLQSNKNLPTLGKKFIELTEEFYKLRKTIHKSDDKKDSIKEEMTELEMEQARKKQIADFLSAYV